MNLSYFNVKVANYFVKHIL